MRLTAVLLASALSWGTLGCGESGDPDAIGEPGRDSDSTGAPAEVGEAGEVRSADPVLQLSYEERRGRRHFLQYCAVCHGETGEGDGFNAFSLDPQPHDLTDRGYLNSISDASLAEVIAQGGRGVNKSVLMPAYGNTLSGSQIEDLVVYLRTLTADPSEAEE